MTPQEARLLGAPAGGALAGAIGAAVARRSNGLPLFKGALAAGLFDGVMAAAIAKMLPGADPTPEQVFRIGAGAAMAGAAIGTTGAAVAESDNSSPVLSGAIAGGLVALLWNAAAVTIENSTQQIAAQSATNTLSSGSLSRSGSLVRGFP